MSLITEPILLAAPDTSSSRFAYSTDGINWTPSDDDFPVGTVGTYIAFGPDAVEGGRLVAVSRISVNNSGSNDLAYSDDGINWTDITANIPEEFDTNVGGIAWNPVNKFFLIVPLSTTNSGTPEPVLKSNDGITWTAHTPVVDDDTYDYPYWSSPGLRFVEGLEKLVITHSSSINGDFMPGSILSSEDGITWDVIRGEVGTFRPSLGLYYLESLGIYFSAAATSHSDELPDLHYSSDGITWQIAADVPILGDLESPSTNSIGGSRGDSIAWNPDLGRVIMAANNVGANYYSIYYSDDATTTWNGLDGSDLNFSATIGSPTAVIYARQLGLFVLLTDDGAAYSADGISWTVVEDILPNGDGYTLIWTGVAIEEPISLPMFADLDMNSNQIKSGAYTQNHTFFEDYDSSAVTVQDLDSDSPLIDRIITALTDAGYPPNGS